MTPKTPRGAIKRPYDHFAESVGPDPDSAPAPPDAAHATVQPSFGTPAPGSTEEAAEGRRTGRPPHHAAPRTPSGRKSNRGKEVSLYFDNPEDRARAKAAFHAWGGLQGYVSETQWMADVIMRAVEDLEGRYNDGQPATVTLRERRRRPA